MPKRGTRGSEHIPAAKQRRINKEHRSWTPYGCGMSHPCQLPIRERARAHHHIRCGCHGKAVV